MCALSFWPHRVVQNSLQVGGKKGLVCILKDSLRILWGFFEDSLRVLWWFIEDSFRILWGFFEDSLKILWGFMKDFWKILGGFLEDFWRILGGFLKDLWRILRTNNRWNYWHDFSVSSNPMKGLQTFHTKVRHAIRKNCILLHKETFFFG